MKFTFDNIGDTLFEEFCFDLLESLDFVNLNWRKGTGLDSSPSDQGRDIQGQLLKKDIDGQQHHEKWFIECKHYKKGVPPEKLQGALTWANSERPNVLLIIVSNFLSNSTKNYLEDYKRNNNPPYRIKVWELKDLENLTAEKKKLREKYGLPNDISFIQILNKYHIVYTMKPQFNTIEYFIELMDSLDKEKRDEAFQMVYFDYVKPRFRDPMNENEKVGDLMIDECNYNAFKTKILSQKEILTSNSVHQIVTLALAWLFSMADLTSLEDMKNKQKWLIEIVKSKIEAASSEDDKEFFNKMLDLPTTTLNELPKRVENAYKTYEYICNELIRKLLIEVPEIKPLTKVST